MARIGLVFGGRSVEHLVSVTSARTVAKGLAAARHEVVPLAIAQSGAWLSTHESAAFLEGDVRAVDDDREVRTSLAVLADAAVDAIFPIVHGTYGEDGTLQGLCEMLGVPYVGPSVATSAVCMDKILTKRVLESAGIDVVPWTSCRDVANARPPEGHDFPLFCEALGRRLERRHSKGQRSGRARGCDPLRADLLARGAHRGVRERP